MSDSIFLTDGNGTITGLIYAEYAGELVIPEYVAGERITAIGNQAFYTFFKNYYLSAVTLPNSVTSIESYAFWGQSPMLSIYIPDSVINIADNAFEACIKLTTVYVDDPNNLSEAVSSYDWSNTRSSGVTFVCVDELYRTSRLVINKLTLDQYRAAKSGGSLADDEVYVVTDLDEVIAKAEPNGSLKLKDAAGAALASLDMWEDGAITHKVGNGGYAPISRVQVVSYNGTGVRGANNACSVTFDFAPKVLIMLAYGSNNKYYPFPFFGKTSGFGGYYIMDLSLLSTEWSNEEGRFNFCMNNSTNGAAKKSADGKTISWHTYGDATAQANASGYKYYVLGIG